MKTCKTCQNAYQTIEKKLNQLTLAIPQPQVTQFQKNEFASELKLIFENSGILNSQNKELYKNKSRVDWNSVGKDVSNVLNSTKAIWFFLSVAVFFLFFLIGQR